MCIDPGLANMGVMMANMGHERHIKTTLKTVSPGNTADRIHRITMDLDRFIEENPTFTTVYIEDYTERNNLQPDGKTQKLIGALILYFKERHYRVIMLEPGAGGWQSKVKKEFKTAQDLKGRGWNEHTRDAWAMCQLVKKGGKK